MKRFTLDRIENNMYVLLEYPDENNELLLEVSKYNGRLAEGDIVLVENNMIVEVLKQETQDMKAKVSNLLEKLKNKK